MCSNWNGAGDKTAFGVDGGFRAMKGLTVREKRKPAAALDTKRWFFVFLVVIGRVYIAALNSCP